MPTQLTLDLLEPRLRSRILVRGTCWLWTGVKSAQGYGRVRRDGRRIGAHRAVYEALVAPIPAGLEPDHTCRNRDCVNPAHIEIVTHSVNMARSANALKTHCPQGHEYSPENTMIAGSRRHCRRCSRARWHRWKAKAKT